MIPLLLIRIGPAEPGDAVDSVSLEFSVIGMRLQWNAPGAPAHYTMPPARCHFDA